MTASSQNSRQKILRYTIRCTIAALRFKCDTYLGVRATRGRPFLTYREVSEIL